MKVKKAIKRLNKAKLLLSSVADEYTSEKSAPGTRDLLRAAVTNIDRARASIDGTSSPPAVRPPAPRPPAVRAPEAAEIQAAPAKPNRRISAEGRIRLSLAAKKRWAAAKRRGARTLAAG